MFLSVCSGPTPVNQTKTETTNYRSLATMVLRHKAWRIALSILLVPKCQAFSPTKARDLLRVQILGLGSRRIRLFVWPPPLSDEPTALMVDVEDLKTRPVAVNDELKIIDSAPSIRTLAQLQLLGCAALWGGFLLV